MNDVAYRDNMSDKLFFSALLFAILSEVSISERNKRVAPGRMFRIGHLLCC
jgi:hypothetical protein